VADNKIVHRVSLEGADKVAKQLESIGLEGDKSFKKVKQAAEESASGIRRAGESFGGLGGKTEQSKIAAERLREVLHTLHPILEQAGLGLGNLGALARVAGAGFVAFGAAIVGSAIVGLAKLADQAATTKKKLTDLGAGSGAFKGIEEDAKKLGTDPDKLTGGLQELLRLRNELNNNGHVIHPTRFEGPDGKLTSEPPPGSASSQQFGNLSDEKLRAANRSLTSLLEAGKAEDPAAARDALLSSLRKSKGLTSEALQGLSEQSYGAADKLSQSLPQHFGNQQDAQRFLQNGGKISPEDVIHGLGNVEPDAVKAAESSRSVSQAFEDLGASAKRLTEEFTGAGAGLAQKIDGVARAIDGVTDHYEKFLHPKEYEPGGSKFTGPVRPEDIAPKSQSSESLKDVFTGDHGDFIGRLVGYLRSSGATGFKGGNPFGEAMTFLKKAATDPGTVGQEDAKPESDHPAEVPEVAKPTAEDQRRLSIEEGSTLFGGKSDAFHPIGGEAPRPYDFSKDPNYSPVTNGPRSEAGDLQQVASLGDTAKQVFESFLGAVTKQPDLKQDGPAVGGGIRGEGEQSPDDATKAVADLGSAADSAGSGLASLAQAVADAVGRLQSSDSGTTAHAARGGLIRHFDGGGHVSGPGTSTSDSIPAMLSDGEFVLNKKAVDRVGVAKLHAANAMGLANGGLIDIPHLALGGLPDLSAPALSDFGASGGGGMDLSHYGTVDLRTDHGDHRVITHEDTLRHMNTAAIEAKTFSAGKKPGWHGGASR
jgi:hypothetical protein